MTASRGTAAKNWGGFYALDIDNAEFVRYLEQTFSLVLDDWGFDLVKLDFLYAAAPFRRCAREPRRTHDARAGALRRLCGISSSSAAVCR